MKRAIAILALIPLFFCTGCDEMYDEYLFTEPFPTETSTEGATLPDFDTLPELHPPTEPPAGESMPPAADVTEPAETAPTENTALGNGVWLAKSADGETQQYYLFLSADRVRVAPQAGGEPVEYPCTVSADAMTLGAGDDARQASVEWTDAETALLLWKDAPAETLTWVQAEAADFQFYTNAELSDMARDYCEAKNGTRFEQVQVLYNYDDTIAIRLYDDAEEQWYTVDRRTAKGTDQTNEEIDLTVPPVSDDITQ